MKNFLDEVLNDPDKRVKFYLLVAAALIISTALLIIGYFVFIFKIAHEYLGLF